MKRYNKIAISSLLSIVLLFSAAFAAIPEGHWFEGIAKTVSDAGFYPKVNDPSFDPDGLLTYSEFAQMATLCLGRAIAYNGDKANDPIARVSILKIINERMGYDVSSLSQEDQILAAIKITDFNDMSQDDKNVVLASCQKGIVLGNESGEVRPEDNATFAEALTMLSRVQK